MFLIVVMMVIWNISNVNLTCSKLCTCNFRDIEIICSDLSLKEPFISSNLCVSECTPQVQLNLLGNYPTNGTINLINLDNFLPKLL